MVSTLESNRQYVMDPLFELEFEYESSITRAANIALELGACSIDFAQEERVPRYNEFSRENDAEHSYMLALVATELTAKYFPELNPGLVSMFSIVHDLLELQTGDVATFNLSDEEFDAKTANEHAALELLCSRLPGFTADLLRRYEAQEEPEARLVRLVDKMLPVIVDILGPGEMVMKQDYNVHTSEEILVIEQTISNRLRTMLPDHDLQFFHDIRDALGMLFADKFRSGSGEDYAEMISSHGRPSFPKCP